MCALVAGSAWAAVDVDALWNFNDPAVSEARFREVLVKAHLALVGPTGRRPTAVRARF
jgi:hypothetical protein